MKSSGRNFRSLTRCASLLSAVLLAEAIAGCGSEGIATHPVKGKLLVKGQPAPGAFVVFHPLSKEATDRPTAQVVADGSFQVTTANPNDGAPEGDYAVTVEWWKLVQSDGGAVAGPNVIPNQYGKAESTPLRVTVKQGENDLPAFEIK